MALPKFQKFRVMIRVTNMGRKPRISLENRGKVLALSEEGYSQEEVAHRVGCSQRSGSDILKKTATYWLCERSQNS